MITKIEQMPITASSYPFMSAEKYLQLSAKGYEETEYTMYGTANVYETVDNLGGVAVRTPDAPYVNRFVVRAPKDPKQCKGNVVIEILNATAFMDLDRMWILTHRQLMRNGDIYIGITSKPNTIPRLLQFDEARYGHLSWKNPTPEVPFDFDPARLVQEKGVLPDLDPSYEPGLFWDMLTDLARLVRKKGEENPISAYPVEAVCLLGWSQSGCYLLRYLHSFAYRPKVLAEGAVFDGYLAAGPVRHFIIPVNQYEAGMDYSFRLSRAEKVTEPFVVVQTESENGRYNAWLTQRPDGDAPDFLYRLYEVTGASHDTMYSLVNYYQNDPDLIRIGALPAYTGLEPEGNDYPSEILFSAAVRNLLYWVREGVAPNHCDRIPTDSAGENKKDAFGNTLGGLRTCLLNYPTGIYTNTSTVPKGSNPLAPEDTKNGLFGYQKAFSKELLTELYGTLAHYKELVEKDTKEQVSRGFVCQADAKTLIETAVSLAKARGLR